MSDYQQLFVEKPSSIGFSCKHSKRLNAFLFLTFLSSLVFHFIYPSKTYALTQREGMSKADAIQYIEDQKNAGYFPIKIEAYTIYTNGVLLGPFLRVRVVPFPQRGDFDFKYKFDVSEVEFNQAKIDYADYFLIYQQPQIYSGYGYNAIWVKNEVVEHDFPNAKVYAFPYPVTSYDLAERLPEHVISFGIGEALSAIAKKIGLLGLSWIGYLDTVLKIYFEFLDYNDPVRVIPLTPEVESDGSEFKGKGACEGGKISGIILLDIVRESTADVDPASLNELKLRSEYWVPNNVMIKDQMVILTKDEINSLAKERFYKIYPKTPLDAPSKEDPSFIQENDFFRLAAITKEDWHIVSYASYPHVFFGRCRPKGMPWIPLLLFNDRKLQGSWKISTILTDILMYDNSSASLAVDSNNSAHISYSNRPNTTTNFYLGYITNVTGAWQNYILDDDEWGYARYSSIGVDGNNKVHISYQQQNQYLKYLTNASGSWDPYLVDGPLTWLGGWTSLDIDRTNKIHISYLEASNADLRYATNISGTWKTSIVASEGEVGYYCSLAVDRNRYVHIVYLDDTDRSIKYSTNSSGQWSQTTIFDRPTSNHSISIAIDGNDAAHAAFWDMYMPYQNLMYATNASGAWVTQIIDSEGDVGRYNSIDIDDKNNIYISYCDETNDNLKYATNASGSWTTYAIDSEGDVGKYSSLAIGPNNKVHIIYYDETNTSLKYAIYE